MKNMSYAQEKNEILKDMSNNVESTYRSLLLNINKKLKNLSELGICLEDLRKRVEVIDIEYKNRMSDANRAYYCREAIEALSKVENELLKYNIYYKAYYVSESIEEKAKRNSNSCINVGISESEINEMVDLMISTLESLKSIELEMYDKVKSIIEKTYKAAYELMKLEFRNLYSSRIFDYLKGNVVIKNYIDAYIEEDILNLNYNSKMKKYIIDVINRIKSSGLEYDYLNENLLLYLSIDEKSLEEISRKIKNIEEENKKFNSQYDACQNNIKDAKEKIIYYKKLRNSHRIKAFILSLITAASFYGLFKAGEAIGRDKTYKTTTTIYSSIDDETKTSSEYSSALDTCDITKLIYYEPYVEKSSGYKRNIYTYDVTDMEIDDIKVYSNDLDKLGRKPTIESEKKKELVPEDLYSEDYYEIVKIVQDIEDMIKDETEARTGGFTFMGVFGSMILMLLIFLDVEDNMAIIGNLIEAHDDNKTSKEKKKKVKTLKEELLALKKKIEENEELKNKMKEKFHELLLDEKELIRDLKTDKKN